jgi:hypothetical protein
MSSKIVEIYYLTEYRFGRTIQAWPKLRYRATSANAANTHGFHGKGMTRNPRCARVVNRLTGTPRASRIAKRQSGAKTGLYACKSTMTMIESFEQRTITVTVCARLIRVTESLFLWVFTWGKNPFGGVLKTWIINKSNKNAHFG